MAEQVSILASLLCITTSMIYCAVVSNKIFKSDSNSLLLVYGML